MTATACLVLDSKEYVKTIKDLIAEVKDDCDEKDITKLYHELGSAIEDMVSNEISGVCYSSLASRLLDDAVSDVQWEYVARHLVMKICPKKTKRYKLEGIKIVSCKKCGSGWHTTNEHKRESIKKASR